MSATPLDGVTSLISTGVSDLVTQIPLILAVAVPVALAFWGAPKLIGLLRRTAK